MERASIRRLGLLIGIIANILGGSTYALQKIALDHGWTPGTVVAARLLIGLPILLATLPRGWRARLTKADAWRLGLVGTLGLAVPHLVGGYGLSEADSQQGAILVGMEPVAIVVLAHLFLGEPLGARQAGGIALALSGALVVVSGGQLDALWAPGATTRGSLLLALHGALWAVYTVAAKPTLARASPTTLGAVTTVIACAIVVPIAALDLRTMDLARALSPTPLACVVALGVGISWLGTILWSMALARMSATLMAALVFLQPITGLALGALLGERLRVSAVVGAAVVFAGVWFVAPRSVVRDERAAPA